MPCCQQINCVFCVGWGGILTCLTGQFGGVRYFFFFLFPFLAVLRSNTLILLYKIIKDFIFSQARCLQILSTMGVTSVCFVILLCLLGCFILYPVMLLFQSSLSIIQQHLAFHFSFIYSHLGSIFCVTLFKVRAVEVCRKSSALQSVHLSFQSLIKVFDLLCMKLCFPRKVSDSTGVNCDPLLDTNSSGLHSAGEGGQESNYSSKCYL